MKLRSILVHWLFLCLNLNWIKLLLIILCLWHYTLRLRISLLPVIINSLLTLIHVYTVSIAKILLLICHHWISIRGELFLHAPWHIEPIFKLLFDLHLFYLSFVVQLPNFILKWLYFPMIIFFYLICSLSLLLDNCFVPRHILFKLRVLGFSCLEYAFHLNVWSFMFSKSSLKLIVFSHYLCKRKLLCFKSSS